jgi:cell division protease FtsH
MSSTPDRGGGDTGQPSSGSPDDKPFWSRLGWGWIWLLLALVGINWLGTLLLSVDPARDRIDIPYTFFLEQVQQGNVASVSTRGDLVRGRFERAVTYSPPATPTVIGARPASPAVHFETRIPAFPEEHLNLLRANGVAVSAEPAETRWSWWPTLLIGFVPALLLFGLIFWMGSRAQTAQNGVFSIGKSRARRYDTASTRERITFADVAGIDEAKADLQDMVDFLRYPQKYQRLGGRVPKGVLLVGPPGTGKTLLAKAMAGEAGVPFFSLSGSEFVEMIVGVGAARVRDLFANAQREAPAIIFIDELDAIGRRRGIGTMVGSNQEQEQTLNQILAEMDGFDERKAVIVLAATNRPDVLDPALLRPGRFDRRVVVQRPDRVGREAILHVHTRGVPLSGDVSLATLAAATPGLVGAELRNLVNEAALLAARNNRDKVTMEDFTTAMEKIILGAERKLVMTEEDRRRVAYHEAGHALMALLSPKADPIRKVSIVPHGQALGVTYQLPLDDRHNYGEDYLRGRISITLGGRVAEELAFDVVSSGAEHDLKAANLIARQMVARWGMSDRLGLIYTSPGGDGFLESEGAVPELSQEISDKFASIVDEETQHLLEECYAVARQTLEEERPRLDALAEALLVQESLDAGEIRQVAGVQHSLDGPAKSVRPDQGEDHVPIPASAA